MPYNWVRYLVNCAQGEHEGTDGSNQKIWESWVIAAKICSTALTILPLDMLNGMFEIQYRGEEFYENRTQF